MSNRCTVGLAALALTLAAGVASAQAKPQGAPAAKPAATSATDQVIAQEKAIYDALIKNDYAAINKAIGGSFTYISPEGIIQWEPARTAELLKGCVSGKWTWKDTKATQISPDIVMLTYTAAGEQTCQGKKSPSPVHALSIWQMKGGKWIAVAHSETTANPPAPTK
jgi:hypothetical protein